MLAPTPVGTRGCWEPRPASPGSVRSGLAWDQVGAVAGRAGGAPPPVPSWLGRKGDVGCGEEALNLGRGADGVEGQRVLTPAKDIRRKTEELWKVKS